MKRSMSKGDVKERGKTSRSVGINMLGHIQIFLDPGRAIAYAENIAQDGSHTPDGHIMRGIFCIISESLKNALKTSRSCLSP